MVRAFCMKVLPRRVQSNVDRTQRSLVNRRNCTAGISPLYVYVWARYWSIDCVYVYKWITCDCVDIAIGLSAQSGRTSAVIALWSRLDTHKASKCSWEVKSTLSSEKSWHVTGQKPSTFYATPMLPRDIVIRWIYWCLIPRFLLPIHDPHPYTHPHIHTYALQIHLCKLLRFITRIRMTIIRIKALQLLRNICEQYYKKISSLFFTSWIILCLTLNVVHTLLHERCTYSENFFSYFARFTVKWVSNMTRNSLRCKILRRFGLSWIKVRLTCCVPVNTGSAHFWFSSSTVERR